MFSWCNNRLEITVSSARIEDAQSWINGKETPRYRHAVQQGIKLFLAGCSGILKPVKATEFKPYPLLTSNGTGASTSTNQAFRHFVEMLGSNVWLDKATLTRLERIYLQSGIDALKWENISYSARQQMTHLMALHYADWFGIAGDNSSFDPQDRWEYLSILPESTCPCDMLIVMASRLMTELNGTGGLFRGVPTTAELYTQLFGTEFPAGHQVRWSRESLNTLVLTFTSPWYPPSGEVMGELSGLFDAEIRHSWKSPDVKLSGFNCFDRGDHVDSGTGEEPQPEGARMYLVTPAPEQAPVPTPVTYGSLRA